MGAFIKDEHAISKDKVRYVGEPVAVVAAEDEATARHAVRLIDVRYEELGAVLSHEEAVAAQAPIVHERLQDYIKVFPAVCYDNVAAEVEMIEGDVDSTWQHCDVIVEDEFETQAQNHLAMEPCGALAETDANGRVSLWSANQSVFRVQANVAESLSMPMSKIRSMTPRVGGGFGNKMEAHVQPLVVALSLATGRPVKLILDREEDFEMIRARHPMRIHCKTGATKDGKILAREVDILQDTGAYADDGPGVLGFALQCSRGPYSIPNARVHGRLVYTNRLRFGAFRGFGNPQVSFAGETQLDQIAERIAMDPLALRLKNLLAEGEPYFGGTVVGSNGLRECLERLGAESGWDTRQKTMTPGTRRGFGLACAGHISGILSSGAIVRILEDGTVMLNTGAVDIGQGSDTALSQICAGALKVPIEQVSIASPDTDGSPYNWGTTASRVTFMTGRAVVGAAYEVERQLKEYAGEMLECGSADLELREGGQIGVKGVPGRQVSFQEISRRCHWKAGGPIVGSDTWVYDKPTIDPKRTLITGSPFANTGAFSFGAMVVSVKIDESTGKTEVDEVWAAVDVGKAINPQSVEGQIEGGFVQGMGMALTEEMVWDGGRLANPSLMDYKTPTSLDAPYKIHSYIIEKPHPEGPFGAKGVGEIPLVTVPAAIANAIADATGARLRRLPMTPERVFAILEDNNET